MNDTPDDNGATCSWDCFTNSIFVSKCDQTGSATSYAKVGELCAGVDTIKAGCQTKDCMTPSAKKGFYRLTADLNCNRVTALESAASGTALSGALEGECKKTDTSLVEGNAKGVDWIRPEEAKRAISRCPKKRWEPITNPEKYTQYSGLLQATSCYDLVSCSPASACLDDNACAEGYEYTKYLCEEHMEKIGQVNCTTSDDCRTMDKKGNVNSLPLIEGQALSSEPQAQSRCVQKTDAVSGETWGRCECFNSPRCSLCTVGNYQRDYNGSVSNSGNGSVANPFFTKGYFRLNGKCKECDDNAWVLVAGFFLGIVALCIGGWLLSSKQFNVAFISIGIDYLQVCVYVILRELYFRELY